MPTRTGRAASTSAQQAPSLVWPRSPWAGEPRPPATTGRRQRGLNEDYFPHRRSWLGLGEGLQLRARSKERDTQGPEPPPYPQRRQEDPQERGGGRRAPRIYLSASPPEVPKPEAHCPALRAGCGTATNKVLGNCSTELRDRHGGNWS